MSQGLSDSYEDACLMSCCGSKGSFGNISQLKVRVDVKGKGEGRVTGCGSGLFVVLAKVNHFFRCSDGLFGRCFSDGLCLSEF